MLPLVQHALLSQYEAALSMLHHCLQACPEERWSDKVANDSFQQVAYHTLFYADLYLSPGEAGFRPRAVHTRGGDERGPVLSPGLPKPEALAYLPDIRQKAVEILATETEASLQGPSGFPWIPFTRFEHHLYNIRHTQHHTGALIAHCRRTLSLTDPKSLPWVGFGWR